MGQRTPRERFEEAYRAWLAEQGIDAVPELVTLGGNNVAPVYTPLDVPQDGERLGLPGEFPYTRGIHPSMYRSRLWTMRQYAGFGSAEDSNRRYRYLLEQGQTGLSVAFDLPTQLGYDSDDPAAAGEVGKVGVTIDTLADMEALFEGIPLDKVTTSMTINAPASVLLAMYVAAGERQGVAPEQVGGTTQNDILKEYIARGTYIFPPGPSMRLITDMFAYGARELPRWNTISISGYHIREAGSTVAQEVGFTLANAIAYVEAAIGGGLEVDDFAPRLAFFWNAQIDLLEEVAKYRAARRLWARLMRERFGARKPASLIMRFHTQTAGASLTAQQPHNNIVRTAIEALAAVLGGTQSLHANSYDEALSLPTEEAVQVALRTQQIIAEEMGVTNTVDPLAGSYYVEALTDRIEADAMDYIWRVDELGGAVKAIESGYQQREVLASAQRLQREQDEGKRVVVGVNRFVSEEPPVRLHEIDPEVARRQRERLEEVRARRDSDEVRRKLEALEEAARGSENLMPQILDCVRAYGSVGEICGRLRAVFGEYRAPTAV